jgi:zinc-ribbon domain
MYCPKCGTQNVDDASFCRGCGVNLSLVPQALEGRAPDAAVEGKHRRRDKHKRDDPPNLTFALVKTFVGLAFIFVALAVKEVYQIAGQVWWFWMLIPAAGSLGAGVAEFLRLYQQQPNQQPGTLTGNAYVPPAVSAPRAGGAELPPRRNHVSDIYTPTSVTENTTKLLDKDQ